MLIDELEQHLHPRCQRFLVAKLARQFPTLQFIAPTHSALCASGVADLDQGAGQLIGLYMEGQEIVGERLELSPGLKADQVLTSRAFRLSDTRTPTVAAKVARYKELFRMRRRTEEEDVEFLNLEQYIEDNVPEAGQLEEERKMQRELRSLVEQMRRARGE